MTGRMARSRVTCRRRGRRRRLQTRSAAARRPAAGRGGGWRRKGRLGQPRRPGADCARISTERSPAGAGRGGPLAMLVARPRRASGQPVPGGRDAAPVATSTPAPPAVEDDAPLKTVDTIAEGELDREDEPAARSVAAAARGATPVIGGRARTSGAPTQATADSYYTSAQIIKLASAGGLAARIARPVQSRSAGELLPDETLKVSSQAVEILFGRTRTAVLRVGDIPLVTERQREYKSRSTQAKDLRSRDQEAPEDFVRTPSFSCTFQHHRDTISRKRSSAARRPWSAASATVRSTLMATTHVSARS